MQRRTTFQHKTYREIVIDDLDDEEVETTNLTLSDSGHTSEPCCMKAPSMNQKELRKLYWLVNSVGSLIQLLGSSHWMGENLART